MSRFIAGCALSLVALGANAQQCLTDGSSEVPAADYSVLIGSNVSCDSVSAPGDEPSIEGCAIQDPTTTPKSCLITFSDDRPPIEVTAWLDESEGLTFEARQQDELGVRGDLTNAIQIVNTEGATNGSNCGNVWEARTSRGKGLRFVKKNGDINRIASTNFCSNGSPPPVQEIVREETRVDCPAEFKTLLDASTYGVLLLGDPTNPGEFIRCFKDQASGAGALTAATQQGMDNAEVAPVECLDRCDACDEDQANDPNCLWTLSDGGNNCQSTGLWSVPGCTSDEVASGSCATPPPTGFEVKNSQMVPSCWEVAADPTGSGLFDRSTTNNTVELRLKSDQRNPVCFQLSIGGSSEFVCWPNCVFSPKGC